MGYGQRIGPKNADIKLYHFTLPRQVATRWLTFNVAALIEQVSKHPQIAAAFANCNQARQCILISMAYQMGVVGLTHFGKMLAALEVGAWQEAETQALESRWAKQTPNRANRHAHTLLTGTLLTSKTC